MARVSDLGLLEALMLITHATVVPDGYGLSYSIGDNYIRWTITSLSKTSGEFKKYLLEAANDVKAMLDRAPVEVAAPKAKL